MPIKGKITSVKEQFFFIDKDYFCHNSKYSGEPKLGAEVEYERMTGNNGKKNAINVKLIKNAEDIFNSYLEELKKGYFANGCLKPELIIKYPKMLAERFTSDSNKNKSSQVRNFFDKCRTIETKYKALKNFMEVKTGLLGIIPFANNSWQKGYVTKEFCEFLEANINLAVEEELNFSDGFIKHFEYLMGFYPKN